MKHLNIKHNSKQNHEKRGSGFALSLPFNLIRIVIAQADTARWLISSFAITNLPF
jgi:hypothetical protein